jgi:hypothetical protein
MGSQASGFARVFALNADYRPEQRRRDKAHKMCATCAASGNPPASSFTKASIIGPPARCTAEKMMNRAALCGSFFGSNEAEPYGAPEVSGTHSRTN